MSHHNNDVCGKSALTYKDSAEGLAEAWVVRRQGAGLRTARYFPGWPEQWSSGARRLGEENLAQVFSHSYARLQTWKSRYEICSLGEGSFPLHLIFLTLEELQD